MPYKPMPEILMAEDNADDAELALGALAECGADGKLAGRTVLVRDGADALDYLHRRGRFAHRPGAHPIFALLDLKMPRVNGLEVLREMKTTPELADIPVVMFSSSREEIDLKLARKLGANAFVVKPVGFREFAEAVREIAVFWGVLNVLRPEQSRSEPDHAG